MDDYGNIIIMGTTGSGKSVLAQAIAQRTGRTVIELDDLNFLPGWRQRAPDDFCAQVAAAIAAVPGGWVAAGNYSILRPVLWPAAHTIVALDYHGLRVFWRLLCRTLSRQITRTPVCNGNVETFDRVFFSRESILLWFFKSHRPRQRKLEKLINDPGAGAHLRIIRLRSPQETSQWLSTL